MKKRIKFVISGIMGSFLLIGIFIFSPSAIANAAVTGSPTIQKGAITVDEFFNPPVTSGNSGSQVITTGPSDQNNGVPFSIITLSGQNNKVGIWSKEEYRMDFSKDFIGRTYVNFGTAKADGFAFVMQNDVKKSAALTAAVGDSDGQNLGVYGGSNSYGSFGNVTTPESSAIKNSVAIEFDLYPNVEGNSLYDLTNLADSSIPHMAYSFPGNLDKGYKPEKESSIDHGWKGFWGTGQYAKIQHYSLQALDGTVGDNIQDSTWYEFRYSFDVNSKFFSYYLKNPITDVQTKPVQIPFTDLSQALNLSGNGNKAYWGFTASNGEVAGEVKFAFSQVPVDLKATITNDVKVQNQSIVDVEDHDEYPININSATYDDQIKITSDLTIEAEELPVIVNNWKFFLNPSVFNLSETEPLKEIKATLDGKTFYGVPTIDSSTGNVTVIFTGLQAISGQTIHFEALGQSQKNGDTKKAVFASRMDGIEVGSNKPLSFNSEEVAFWIHYNNPTVLSWENPNVKIDKEENLNKKDIPQSGYQGKFFWQESDNNEELRFYVKKGTSTIQRLVPVITSGIADFTEANFTIPSTALEYGENQFVIEVYGLNKLSGERKEAAELHLTINVRGELIFQAAPTEFKWTNRLAGETKGTMTRDVGNKQQLSVLDSRENAGTWSIGVSATTQANTPFHLIWQGKGASQTTAITNKTQIAMKAGDVAAANYVSTQEWSESEGVLLQSDEYLRVGDYSGKITVHWQLYDTATAD
jgi:hypothetical protein